MEKFDLKSAWVYSTSKAYHAFSKHAAVIEESVDVGFNEANFVVLKADQFVSGRIDSVIFELD